MAALKMSREGGAGLARLRRPDRPDGGASVRRPGGRLGGHKVKSRRRRSMAKIRKVWKSFETTFKQIPNLSIY